MAQHLAIVKTYVFDSFGKQTVSTDSLTNSFGYTAWEFDTETRLYYYRARYYDPTTGRFLGQDPIGFNGGTNFYASGYNNPIVSKDPFGTCTITLYFEHTGKHANGPLYHSFLTLTNPGNNGNTFVFRGGPSANGAPPPQEIVSAELDRLGVSPDAPSEAVYSIKLLDNDCSCAPFFENLYDYERKVDQRKVPYGWTHNSNSVTSDALGVLGLAAPSIPWWIGPLLPGWGNSLLPGTGGGGGGW